MITDQQVDIAVEVLGTLDSRMGYSYASMTDPLTVGILTWRAGRAAALLARIRDETPYWVDIPETFTFDLDTYPSSSAFWETRWVDSRECYAIMQALNNARHIQSDQARKDVRESVQVGEALGLDGTRDLNALFFFLVMHDQSPVDAATVVRDVSPAAPMHTLRQAATNNLLFSQHAGRYDQAVTIIPTATGQAVDDDPGGPVDEPETWGDPAGDDEPGTGSGSGGSTPTTRPSNVDLLYSLVPGIAMLKTSDGIVRLTQINDNIWKASKVNNTGGQDPDMGFEPGPPTPPPSGGDEKRNALIAYADTLVGKFRYAQAPGRLTPITSGLTDCSGFVRWCYLHVLGITLGGNTVAQYNQGTRVKTGTGRVTVDGLLPGDLIYYDWPGGRTTVDHVEMVHDTNGGGHTIGHGSGQGPKIKSMTTYRVPIKYFVQRHI